MMSVWLGRNEMRWSSSIQQIRWRHAPIRRAMSGKRQWRDFRLAPNANPWHIALVIARYSTGKCTRKAVSYKYLVNHNVECINLINNFAPSIMDGLIVNSWNFWMSYLYFSVLLHRVVIMKLTFADANTKCWWAHECILQNVSSAEW